MKFDISIEEYDKNLRYDLFGIESKDINKVLAEKQKTIIDKGISLQYKHHVRCFAENVPSWIVITVEISKDVALPLAVGIISSYIYDKLKNRKNERVVIFNQTVEINAKKIEKLIIHNINQSEESKKEEEKA